MRDLFFLGLFFVGFPVALYKAVRDPIWSAVVGAYVYFAIPGREFGAPGLPYQPLFFGLAVLGSIRYYRLYKEWGRKELDDRAMGAARRGLEAVQEDVKQALSEAALRDPAPGDMRSAALEAGESKALELIGREAPAPISIVVKRSVQSTLMAVAEAGEAEAFKVIESDTEGRTKGNLRLMIDARVHPLMDETMERTLRAQVAQNLDRAIAQADERSKQGNRDAPRESRGPLGIPLPRGPLAGLLSNPGIWLHLAFIVLTYYGGLTAVYDSGPGITRAMTGVLLLIPMVAIVTSVRSAWHFKLFTWAWMFGVWHLCMNGVNYWLSYGGRADSAGGQGGESNFLGAIIVSVTPIAFALTLNLKSLIGRGLGLAAAGCYFLGVLASGSRAALLALMGAVGYWMMHTNRKLIAVGLSFVAVACFLAVAPEAFWQRMRTITGEQDSNAWVQNRIEPSKHERLVLWDLAIDIWKDHPVKGIGPMNYPIVSARETTFVDAYQGKRGLQAHNTWLQLLAEYGIIGASVWGGAFIYSLLCYRRAKRRMTGYPGWEWFPAMCLGLEAGTLGTAVMLTFNSFQWYDYLYWQFVFGPVCLQIANETARRLDWLKAPDFGRRPAATSLRPTFDPGVGSGRHRLVQRHAPLLARRRRRRRALISRALYRSLLMVALAVVASPAAAANLALCVLPESARVDLATGRIIDPEGGAPCAPAGAPLRLRGLADEVLALQLEVTGAPATYSVAVELPDLRTETFLERALRIPTPSDSDLVHSLGPGLYPDPLVRTSTVILPSPPGCQVLWIDIHLPREATPGVRRGRIELAPVSGGAAAASVELAVEVLPLQMPARDVARLGAMNFGSFIEREARDPRYLLSWMQLAHAHYLSVEVMRPTPPLDASNRPDWGAWARRIGTFVDGQAFSEVQGYRGPRAGRPVSRSVLPHTDWWPTSRTPDGLPTDPKRWSEALAEWEAFAVAQGWFDLAEATVWYLFVNSLDEPKAGEVLASIQAYEPLIEAAGLQDRQRFRFRVDGNFGQPIDGWSDERMAEALGPVVDVWNVHGAMYTAPWSLLQARRREHREAIMFYASNTSGEPAIPPLVIDSPLAGARAWGWIVYRYGLDGALNWEVDVDAGCVDNPRCSEGGTMNLDATLIYRGEELGLAPDRPIPSMRLKVLRRGAQDAGLLALLEARDLEAARKLSRIIVPTALGDGHADDGDLGAWPRTSGPYVRARRFILDRLQGLPRPTPLAEVRPTPWRHRRTWASGVALGLLAVLWLVFRRRKVREYRRRPE